MKRIQLWFMVGATLIAASTAKADYSVTAVPGYTAIANQLDNGGNTLDEVLPFVPGGCEVLKWDCTTWQVYTFDDLDLVWLPAGGTLTPGEGAWFYNPSGSAITLTFTGTPHVPVLPAALPCGCGNTNFLSCQTATAGTYENITGKSPTEGAVIVRWNAVTQAWDTYTFSGGAWSPAVPLANVGESVFVKVPCDTNLYKWYQPPVTGGHPTNVFYGWNQISTEYAGQPNWQAADDWVCTTTNPVTKVRWWGSFANWQATNLPPSLSGNGALNGFWIVFFADVPAGMDLPFSHPAYFIMPPLARFYTNYTWRYVGRDYDPRTGTYESCFLFEQVLQKDVNVDWWFYQNNSPSGTNIYWLSIIANQWGGAGGGGAVPPADHFFGWKTRPRSSNSPAPDDAVTYNIDAYTPGSGVPFNFQPIWWPAQSNSWDLAFELITANAANKWLQPPDLSTDGMDINATSNNPTYLFLLADDFQCTSTGPITNITIWGSWEYDNVPMDPANVIFTLSFHTNVPPGTVPWSMPGTMRWKRTFLPGQFTCTVEQSGLNEWWMEPPAAGFWPGDTTCYRYDFPVPTGYFVQQGSTTQPAIYWLDVQAQLPQGFLGHQFGWKTSTSHWMDAACWVPAAENYNGNGWQMLTYPPQHPLYGQHIDLAFRLNASDLTKWSQLPVAYTPTNGFNGWDQYSVYNGTNIVADDWVCTNGAPVTDIHWWGSFVGWGYTNLPGILPSGFVISIWSDVPKGSGVPFSHPGVCLTNIYSTAVAPTFVGWDYDPRYPGNLPDACFYFEQNLTRDQWFRQAPGTNTYWISIAAQYAPAQVPDYPWAWKTRPRDTNSLALDDAVRIFSPTAPVPGVNYQAGTNIWWPTTNSSWDMAFALTTSSNCAPPTINCTNLTVQCGSQESPPYAWDNCCNLALTPVLAWSQTNGYCPWLITETWLATDCQGQTNSCTRVVTIVDTNPPALTCATNKTVQCGTVWSFDPPTASDVCCGTNVTVTIVSTVTNGYCPWLITRTWKATDCCSNTATCSQMVTMVDTNPPVITCVTNKTVQCGTLWSFDPPTASDVCCGTNVTVTIVSTVTNGYCPWLITRTWKATDCCSNTATCNQTVTVVDTNPPVLTCATNKTIQCGSVWSFDSPTASDTCCGTNVTVTILSTVTNGSCPWNITRTWVVTNCCNLSNACSQTVTVVDTTPPVLTCAGNKTVQCGLAWSFDSPTASDACCGTNVTVTILRTVTNGSCPWNITRTWVVTNCCSLSNACSQTVTIVDTTPPTVSCSGNKTVNSLAALSFDLPTISDSCCGTNYTLSFYDRSNSPCPLTVMRTWVVTNCCSLSNACSQTVTIVLTNTPPADTNILKYVQWPKTIGGYDVYDRTVIFLADDFPCTNTGPITDIHIWCSYLYDGVTNPAIWLGIWSDVPAVGTNISHPGQLLWQQIFMPDQYQQYFWGCGAEQYFIPSPSPFICGPDSQVYYSVFYTTNGFVQQGTPANPTNYWLSVYCPDTNNPWFGWKTATNVYHDTAVWNFWPPGASTNWSAVKDPYLGTPLDLAFKITTSTNQCPPPTITCNNLTVECGSQVSPPFAYDNCCNTALTPVLTGSVTNGTCPWIITETWKATDCHGQTNSCTRQVKVVDTTPPVITCAPNITVQCGSTWNFNPPAASDACCGTNVTVTVSSTGTNGACPWIISRVWKATDCCSNFNTCTQTVTVVDTTPPTITCVPNKTVMAGSAWSFDPPSASDICCGTNLTINILNTFTSSPCPLIVTRTWAAIDCCTNSATCSQTVTVLNTNTPPADTNTVKFVQWPKTIGGYDVYDRTVLFLADDFRCTNTGPITDIHIWCSYSNDEVSNPPIWLSIWSDVPAGPTNNYSHPGQLLWQQSFTPDKYQRYFWGCGAEKFYMPWGSGFYLPDTQVYYYVFYPTNAFLQQGTPQSPVTYWLSVYCLDNSFFGWKTSTNAFQDAAVWAFWPPSTGNTWTPMTDPDFGGPLNMAFKITTSTNQPPVPTVTTKFIQYPDRSTNGLDVRATQPKILADDFKCIRTGPIRGVTVWGSWLNDLVDTNAQFLLGLWTDVPARGNQPSHPGVLITNTWFYPPGNPNQSLLRYRYQRVATGQENFFDPNLNQIIGADTQIWQYDFFPTVWKEAGMPFAPKTYWLSVTANANTNLYLFGWKTSTNRWGDDAVFGHVNSAWQPLNDWLELRDPRNSVSLNQAFAIKTFDVYHLNKDFYNLTHQVADTFEIVLLGTYDVTWHYDDFVHTAWPNFTVVYSGGNTILRWSGGAVGPGQMTHVGFEVPYVCPPVQVLATRWLAGGVIIGSPIQVNFQRTATTVQFLNTVFTPPSPMYLGNATIEYYPDAQPLDQLNPDTIRTPIRTDIIIPPGPVETIPVGGTDIHAVPPPPAGATYAVHVFQVSTNETLTLGATTDFVQMPLDTADPPIITWIDVGTGTATLWWTAIPCRTYRLVATTNVETPLASWASMGDIPAGSDVTSLSMMVPIDSLSRQFYRVELLPVTP